MIHPQNCQLRCVMSRRSKFRVGRAPHWGQCVPTARHHAPRMKLLPLHLSYLFTSAWAHRSRWIGIDAILGVFLHSVQVQPLSRPCSSFPGSDRWPTLAGLCSHRPPDHPPRSILRNYTCRTCCGLLFLLRPLLARAGLSRWVTRPGSRLPSRLPHRPQLAFDAGATGISLTREMEKD